MSSDHFVLGDWNAVCYECGRKKKASQLKKHWQGYMVCPEHWEPRHPQDFVSAPKAPEVPTWTQPMPADQFVADAPDVDIPSPSEYPLHD